MEIFSFLKNLFRYNRDVHEEFESIWNVLTGGKAIDAGAHHDNTFINFLIYLAAVVLTLFSFLVFPINYTNEIATNILLLTNFVLATINYYIWISIPKSAKFRLLFGSVSCVAIGIILGLISFAF